MSGTKPVVDVDDLESKVVRIAEKLLYVADRYFVHPLKIVNFRVPFTKSDILRIKLRDSVNLSHFYHVYCGEQSDLCISGVDVYPHCSQVDRLEIIFDGGEADSLVLYCRDITVTVSFPLFSIVPLFASDALSRIEEADVNSDNEVAAKWFRELLDTYKKEAVELATLVKLGDMYEDGRHISYVSSELHIFKRYDTVLVASVELELRRPENEVRIIVRRNPHPNQPIIVEDEDEYITVKYSLEARRLILIGDELTRSVVAEYPVEVLDGIGKFMEELVNTYMRFAVVANYLYYVF